MTEQTHNQPVEVCSILPFWRYAVCPTSGHSPGIPFYRKSSAKAFFEDAKTHLPFSGVQMFRRRLGGLELIEEFTPDPKWKRLTS